MARTSLSWASSHNPTWVRHFLEMVHLDIHPISGFYEVGTIASQAPVSSCSSSRVPLPGLSRRRLQGFEHQESAAELLCTWIKAPLRGARAGRLCGASRPACLRLRRRRPARRTTPQARVTAT